MTYRFSVLSYRVGEILEVLVLITMWSAIYKDQAVIQGFTLKEMVTYMLIGNLVSVMTRNFLSDVVAREVKDGQLSMFLVRPMPYISYTIIREVGRITLSTVVSVASQAIIILFFLDKLILNPEWKYLGVIAAMVLLAFVTEVLLSLLIGLVAFWTLEVAGIFTTVDRIKKFFSGGYFPISLLPPIFAKSSFLLPFAYTFFVPAQLYLKKMDIETGLKGLGVQLVWIGLLSIIIKFVWRRGLKKYEGVGI